MLTAAQHVALNIILTGHNIALTGQAGTGKSFLLKEAISCLTNEKKCVALLGCLQFIKEGAQVQYNGGLLEILECVVLKTNLLP